MTGQTIILASDKQRHLAKQLIDRAPPSAVVNVREATRTLEQNSKMQAMLSDIARFKPQGRTHSSETWKALFMDSIGIKPKWVPSIDGDSVVNEGFRSSRLTKAKMSEMIEAMYAKGAEWGILWSEPDAR